MSSKTVEVRNSTGLYACPVACLTKAAKKYNYKVTLRYEGNDTVSYTYLRAYETI